MTRDALWLILGLVCAAQPLPLRAQTTDTSEDEGATPAAPADGETTPAAPADGETTPAAAPGTPAPAPGAPAPGAPAQPVDGAPTSDAPAPPPAEAAPPEAAPPPEPAPAGAPAPDAPAADAAKLAWRGTSFSFEQDLTTHSLDRGAQLSYNPTYVWSFSLAPRWYLSDELSLRLRQDFDVELTQSDSRTTDNELWFYDTRLELGHSNLLEVEGVKLSGSVRVSLPLSKTSQALNRVLGTGLGVNASRSIEGVLEGMSLSTGLGYNHYWSTSNVASIDEVYPCALAEGPTGERRVCDQTGGPSTVRDSFSLNLGVDLTPIERLTFALSFGWSWSLGHGLADAVVPVDTAPGGFITLADESATHWRNSTSFSVEAGYEVTDWLTGTFGLSTGSSQLNPNGSLRNPFYNYDSQLYLTAGFALDKLYGAFTGTAEASATAARPAAPERL